jgi:RNA polymerase sigma-70 factor (ECF subfamily)
MKTVNLSVVQERLVRAKQGDAAAFGFLYDTFLDQIYRFVYVRVGNREDAEDVAEQVFLAAFKGIVSYEDRGVSFEAWLYTIARNKIIDHYRTKKVAAPLETAEQIQDKGKLPDEITEEHLMHETLMNTIHTLPPAYQEIIFLKYIEDLENPTISSILGKPVDQIRVLQQRALKKLKSLMEKHI